MTTPATWQPFQHSPRHPILTCSGCGDRQINESNLLRRHGWQETVSTPRRYRCATCATIVGDAA